MAALIDATLLTLTFLIGDDSEVSHSGLDRFDPFEDPGEVDDDPDNGEELGRFSRSLRQSGDDSGSLGHERAGSSAGSDSGIAKGGWIPRTVWSLLT